jgi:hypothetical protein
MTLEPGKPYRIDKWFWFLFPSLETAAAAAVAAAVAAREPAAAAAAAMASYWSKRLNCTVSFLNEGDMIMVVEVSGIQVKVINQEGKSGWINFPATEGWTKTAIVEAFNDT